MRAAGLTEPPGTATSPTERPGPTPTRLPGTRQDRATELEPGNPFAPTSNAGTADTTDHPRLPSCDDGARMILTVFGAVQPIRIVKAPRAPRTSSARDPPASCSTSGTARSSASSGEAQPEDIRDRGQPPPSRPLHRPRPATPLPPVPPLAAPSPACPRARGARRPPGRAARRSPRSPPGRWTRRPSGWRTHRIGDLEVRAARVAHTDDSYAVRVVPGGARAARRSIARARLLR